MKTPRTRAAQGKKGAPPRIRCRLRSIDDVRVEIGRIYREGKGGRRDVGEVSKLANVLSNLGRLIVDSEFEARLRKLEDANV